MIKAAILAGTNPAIPRLVHLLNIHPDVELVAFACSADAGRRLDDKFPPMTGETDLRISSDLDLDDVDVLFLATEPGSARNYLRNIDIPSQLALIDMSGDFLVADDTHDFVYGIAETNRKSMVRGARHVAIPSPTAMAITLALLPAAKNLMLNAPITVSVATDDPKADIGSLLSHPIEKNITAQLTDVLNSIQSSFSAPISGTVFTGDMHSGTMAVVSTNIAVDIAEMRRIYKEYYDDHNFTFVVERQPDIADVRGTNKCLLHLDTNDNRLTITTVIDSEIKGNAGNAIHAMNLVFGLFERVGL